MADFRDDIQAALDRMNGGTMGLKKPLKNLPMRLHEGERVLAVAGGQYGGGMGVLVLTDDRIIFVREGMGVAKFEDFELDKVSSIEESSGMMAGEIKIFASGNNAHIKSIQKDDAKAFGEQARNQMRRRRAEKQAPPPAAAAAAPAAADPIEQLRKLAELRDAGIVSPEEFEAKKQEIMSRI